MTRRIARMKEQEPEAAKPVERAPLQPRTEAKASSLQIYEDMDQTAEEPKSSSSWKSYPPEQERDKENTQKPTSWNAPLAQVLLIKKSLLTN
jgi:hypothetical protein